MLIDLHVHSRHTRGGALSPAEALAAARAAGLDGVLFTDLGNLDGLEEVRAAGRDAGVLALVGLEVSTDLGHFLCVFPDPAAVPPPAQLFGSATPWPAREVLARVKAMGGAVVAAHPYDRSTGSHCGDHLFTLDGIDAVQGLHGRRRGGHDDLAVEAADHLNLPCVGGSGALASAAEVATAATLFRDPVASEADVVAQLRAGSVYCVAMGVEPPPERPEERGGRAGRGDRPDRGRGSHGGPGGGRERGRGAGDGGRGGRRRGR